MMLLKKHDNISLPGHGSYNNYSEYNLEFSRSKKMSSIPSIKRKQPDERTHKKKKGHPQNVPGFLYKVYEMLSVSLNELFN